MKWLEATFGFKSPADVLCPSGTAGSPRKVDNHAQASFGLLRERIVRPALPFECNCSEMATRCRTGCFRPGSITELR